MVPRFALAFSIFASCCVLSPALARDHGGSSTGFEIGGVAYRDWKDFHERHVLATGRKCLTPALSRDDALAGPRRGDPGDCAVNYTNPAPEYAPHEVYLFDVVVHVIRTDTGTQGDVSPAMVRSQIDILNEDFLALPGTNGVNGEGVAFQFRLAARDPSGNPTDGITYSNQSTWFNEGGSYWNTLAWDPDRYINVYTTSAGGALGYVPWLPQALGANPGGNSDRIVILWSAFGRDAPYGPPYDQGRTLTHEMGHYFGLEHTFAGACAAASPPDCYMSGDLICDTNPESGATFGCPAARTSCELDAPFDNYMDYSDDLCMERFTPEQARRMRCTLQSYRASLIRRVRVAATTPGDRGSAPPGETPATAPAPVRAQPRPNPFRGSTDIRFELSTSGPVSLRILDVRGRTIRTLSRGDRGPGLHTVAWDGRSDASALVAPGVYFYRLETASGAATGRLIRLE